MTLYKRVLVAVDLNGGADEVLEKASGFLLGDAVDVTVINVVYDPVQLYDSYMGIEAYSVEPFSAPDEAQVRQQTLPIMQTLIDKVSLPNPKLLVEFGRTVNTILETADKFEADLILLGSHGRHGIGLLLGSTANGVLHRAKCDVLAVRIKEPK